ncbi:hypothetical protein M595_1590 [Lyngbya aestuarii BL J]|uniref:Uncharacterized protein n=1 Tax=Lyngbya aestuarii BL J TaxID=1348334 RepID=U7QM36_9CYAN|nr:hypothetical protein M595_1590 [Lyngbya aestuarii BL J]
MNWKIILIFLMKCLHFLILFFVLFGWIIPGQLWRIIHHHAAIQTPIGINKDLGDRSQFLKIYINKILC